MIPGIPDGALVPLGGLMFIILVIVLVLLFGVFVPRWVLTRLVKAANERADLMEKLYNTERVRGDVVTKIATDLTVVGETQVRILEALPRTGDSERVSR